jgi:hypothetical protein
MPITFWLNEHQFPSLYNKAEHFSLVYTTNVVMLQASVELSLCTKLQRFAKKTTTTH